MEVLIMAVPKVDGQFIAEAIKYIDENGVPWHNTSTKYELVWENGKTYPPKYVIRLRNGQRGCVRAGD